jgi:predicted AAA+ superfamily ATPase
MTLEVDVLMLKQIEQNYLSKLRKLLYLLSLNLPCSPNVSRLSKAIHTSRATVMNYIKYLKEARMISLLYETGEEQSKKPSKVYMYNTNLIKVMHQIRVDELAIYETFFCNQLLKDNRVNTCEKNARFLINGNHSFQIMTEPNPKISSDAYQVVEKIETGEENMIPLWLFGFLY